MNWGGVGGHACECDTRQCKGKRKCSKAGMFSHQIWLNGLAGGCRGERTGFSFTLQGGWSWKSPGSSLRKQRDAPAVMSHLKDATYHCLPTYSLLYPPLPLLHTLVAAL